jgi:hypothetical protein
MITQEHEHMRTIEEYTKKHNVNMIALGSVLDRAMSRDMTKEKYIEDIAINLKLFLYDMHSIHENMVEDMSLLWEMKDKTDDKRDTA